MAKYPIKLPSGQIIVLDSRRTGDRLQLARIIAQIALRLAKEDAGGITMKTDEKKTDSPVRE